MNQQRDPFVLFRPQVLREYVASYNSLAAMASVATSRATKDTATKSAIVNPEGRRAPKTIEPWRQYDMDMERTIIETVLRETDSRQDSILFPERQHVIHVGEDLARLDSENALLLYDADTLHKPAIRILRSLLAVESVREAITLAIQHHSPGDWKRLRPGKVSFPTHRNMLPPPPRPAMKRKRDDNLDPSPNDLPSFRRLGPADIFCIFEPHGSRKAELLLVKEAKAPHKLTSEIIEKAIGAGDRILDLSVIMARGYPGSDANPDPDANPGGLDVEECEYWFAAVCTQLYTSMIDEGGLRYGIVSTGTHYIFVTIDPVKPSILRYSVSKNPIDFHDSPLLRLIALTLLALHGPTLPGIPELGTIERRQGLNWITGRENPSVYDDGTSPAPKTESWRETSGHGTEGGESGSTDARSRGSGIVASNCTSASAPPVKVQAQGWSTSSSMYPSPPRHDKSITLGKRQRQDEDDNVPETELEAAPTSLATKRPKLNVEEAADTTSFKPLPMPTAPTSPPAAASSRRISLYDRDFCTTACLVALRRRDQSQPRPPCPNHADHVCPASTITEASQLRQHLLDELTGEMSWQNQHQFLWTTTGSGYTQPVKIRLKSHGYVLFAKVFQPQEVRKMRQEAQIYNRLRHLQGTDVPVCLGTIELPIEKSLMCSGLDFTGLLLLSDAGFGLDAWPRLGLGLGEGGEADRSWAQSLTAEVSKALGRIHEKGVLHRDVALRNVLVQKVTRPIGPLPSHPTFYLQVQLIDFELSRTRAGFRYNAKRLRELKGEQKGDAGRSTDEIGNEGFAKACAKEMEWCHKVIPKWYDPRVSKSWPVVTKV